MFCTMMWTLPVLVLGLVVHGIHVLGLVALIVRDLGLVVFVVPVLVGQLCPLARCADHSVNHSF